MNDKQLRSFISAADMKSFSKAAAASYISPPAMISQINILEKDLGFPLFDRGTHGIELNEQGRTFYKAAQEILAAYDAACAECRKQLAQAERKLRIVAVSEYFLSQYNEEWFRFRTEHPEIRIEYEVLSIPEMARALEEGTADIYLCGEPVDRLMEGKTFYPFETDTYSFIVWEKHPLASRKVIDRESLRGQQVVSYLNPYQKVNAKSVLEGCDVSAVISEVPVTPQERWEALFGGKMVMLPSHWSHRYPSPMVVIPSELSAGAMGVVLKDPVPDEVREFILQCQRQ